MFTNGFEKSKRRGNDLVKTWFVLICGFGLVKHIIACCPDLSQVEQGLN